MIEISKDIAVKVYGALWHCNFMEMEISKEELVTGKMISIEDHPYTIVSIIETAPNQYAMNVMLQTLN
ncbi:MAG: hypothetical protein HQM14_07710 [SAR324 cluster bacterium]|nr:hypothetical protein [SAR324 cluster bacterium]